MCLYEPDASARGSLGLMVISKMCSLADASG